MAGRTLAIGDIHGCHKALVRLLDAVRLDADDTPITLGDLIDRGPDSRAVLDRLIDLASCCRMIPVMEDHEEMLAGALRDSNAIGRWLRCGGAETLGSYGWTPGGYRRRLEVWIPASHRAFLANCLDYHETETHLFVHAGYLPEPPMDQQPKQAVRWKVTDAATAAPHCSGKVAVVGHTTQRNGEILDLGF